MYVFKLLGGDHVEGGKTYKRGDLVKSNQDLFKLFGDKFLPVDVPKEKEVSPEPVADNSEKTMKFGKEVTEMFPDANDNGFSVFRKGTGYFVFDADSLDTPLNKKALNKKDAVALIKEQI